MREREREREIERERERERERDINNDAAQLLLLFIYLFFFFIIFVTPKLLADPLLYSRGPLVVRGPSVENHCFRGMIVLSCIAIQNEIT